ncbi:hypothetical protein [Chitinophaga defluvii]|uniref:YcxB-like protein n=1 Tax=Chitinophaga defluvii TaxID=3163343 RepID=A0ABV2TE97_9BACT
MPVVYDIKNKALPGYLAVYEKERSTIPAYFNTCITPTNDKSMHTFMIRYTPENTFEQKASGFNIFGGAITQIAFIPILLILVVALLAERNFTGAAISGGLLLLLLVKMLLPYFDKSGRTTVRIDSSGIVFPKSSFLWEEIKGTFIVNRYERRNMECFLALVLINDTIVYFPLAAYANNGPKFATAIKHFKPLKSSSSMPA